MGRGLISILGPDVFSILDRGILIICLLCLIGRYLIRILGRGLISILGRGLIWILGRGLIRILGRGLSGILERGMFSFCFTIAFSPGSGFKIVFRLGTFRVVRSGILKYKLTVDAENQELLRLGAKGIRHRPPYYETLADLE
uniref:Uncharacterized protein n=1 Tax=Cacopsylla melanoneura TaxID=428564 RepID=A0A8D9A454_9HEMI